MKHKSYAPAPLIAVLVFMASAPAHAQEANPLIQQGISQYNELEYESSINTLSAALIRPGNSNDDKITIYRYLGLNYLILGREAEADGAFRSLLAIDEDWALDPVSTSPKVLEFFASTKQQWIADGKPGMEQPVKVSTVKIFHKLPDKGVRDEDNYLKIELENPKKIPVKVAVLYRKSSDEKFNETFANMSGYSNDMQRVVYMATIPGADVQPPSVEYFIEVRNTKGEVLSSKGEETAALRIPVPEEGKKKKTWLWGLIGGLGAAVVVGLVVGLAVGLTGDEGGNGNGTPEPAVVTIVICEEGTSGCE
ncbi:MAG: hypothetical protein ABIJ56_08010 [Pseudomonadota bacterium]